MKKLADVAGNVLRPFGQTARLGRVVIDDCDVEASPSRPMAPAC